MVGVDLDAPLSDQIPKKLPVKNPEYALLGVELHPVLPQEVESFAQMLEVIRAENTFHQHVINVRFHYSPDQIPEDFVNHALEGGPGVFEPKGITL